jgi:hypothetical protein
MKKYSIIFISLILFHIITRERIYSQPLVHVPKINSTVTIDGVIDATWNNLVNNPITYLIDGTGYPQANDCSGYFKAFWNNDTLYVMIHALDDILYTDASDPWINDGFEIYLNVDHVKDTIYTNDCFQFRFIPGSDEITGRHGLNYLPIPPIDYAIIVNEGIDRTIEAVFPLVDVLNKNNTAKEGDTIGFEIEILDNDGSGRDHVLSWNNNEHMAWYNPAKMGTMIFDGVLNSTVNIEAENNYIYPNPAESIVTIVTENPIQSWSLYSAYGQLIQTESNLHQKTKLDFIEKLSSGTYILKVSDINGNTNCFKLLKK